MGLFTESALAWRYGAPIDRVIASAFLGEAEAEATTKTEKKRGGKGKTQRDRKATKERRKVKRLMTAYSDLPDTELDKIIDRNELEARQIKPGELHKDPDTKREKIGIKILEKLHREVEAAEANKEKRELKGSSKKESWIRKHGDVGLWSRFAGTGSILRRNPVVTLGGIGAAGLLGAYLLNRARRGGGAEAHQPPPPPPHVADQFSMTHNPMPYPYMPHRQHPWVE